MLLVLVYNNRTLTQQIKKISDRVLEPSNPTEKRKLGLVDGNGKRKWDTTCQSFKYEP
jgi:hypothetical protein